VTLRKRRFCPWVNTLCRRGTHWKTLADPKFISLTTIQVGKKIKDRKKGVLVLTHGQKRLFRKVTSVSIHNFGEWLDIFSYVLQPADLTVKEVNHIRCFVIDIAKDLMLLSCVSKVVLNLFECSTRLLKILVAFRRPKSIMDTLVRAVVSRPSSTVG
jgi:hypothetical protein